MLKNSTAGSSRIAGTPLWKPSDRICAARAVGDILNDLLQRLDNRTGLTG